MRVLQALQRLHLLNIYLLTNAAELGLKVVQALRGSMCVHMVWVHDHRVGSSGSGHGWGQPPRVSGFPSLGSQPPPAASGPLRDSHDASVADPSAAIPGRRKKRRPTGKLEWDQTAVSATGVVHSVELDVGREEPGATLPCQRAHNQGRIHREVPLQQGYTDQPLMLDMIPALKELPQHFCLTILTKKNVLGNTNDTEA